MIFVRSFLVCVALCAGSSLGARELFQATATNGVVTITNRNHNFIDLISAVVRNTDDFAVLAGTPVSADISYLGIGSAVQVTQDFSGRSVRFRIARIGFDRTFTGATPAAVQRQIEDFLKKDGSDIVAKFRKSIGFESAFSITDGNPSSTTASAARSVFFSQGFTTARELIAGADTDSRLGRGALSLNRNSVEAKIQGVTYSGEQLRADGNLGSLRIHDRLRLELPFSADYTDIEGTEIYGAGATLAAPWRITLRTPQNPLAWRFTPVFGLQTRASFDAVAGGLSWHTGAVNTLDWHATDRVVLSLINQLTTHQGFPLNIQGYTLDFDINQNILKNGLRLGVRMGSSTLLSAYLVDTQFLNNAAIDEFYTAGLSLDLNVTSGISLGAGVESDIASDYRSTLARLQGTWKW